MKNKLMPLFLLEKKSAGKVPLYSKILEIKSPANTLHYFYVNNPPTDQLSNNLTLKMLMKMQKSAEQNPITWVNGHDEEQAWLKEIQAIHSPVINDFKVMKEEVRKTQGVSFSFTGGFSGWFANWLLH